MSDPTKIIRLIDAKGAQRRFQMDDGMIVARSGGTISWRNNNPGNLKFEYADSADKSVHAHRSEAKALRAAQDKYDGVVGLDRYGNAVFETMAAGREAQLKALHHRFGSSTVEEMVERYSTKDYSGPTHHNAQITMIYRVADSHGIDLRNLRINQMTAAQLGVLADGVARFEGFNPGTEERSGNLNRSHPIGEQASPRHHLAVADHPGHAIYDEAELHFFSGETKFEYGRPDAPRPGRDTSRLEQDGDGDGRLGVDCSAFVWRGLKNAGFAVSGSDASGFSTHTLFNGTAATSYARSHFEVIPASEARVPGGRLERGDLLLFSDGHSQHVGIFKGYDGRGHLHFIGSQGTSGPREVNIEPNEYWDGRSTHIVGALRARPEFQVRAPLHPTAHHLPATELIPSHAMPTASARAAQPATPSHSNSTSPPPSQVHRVSAHQAAHPSATESLQHTLNRLGARDAHGRPLAEDGVFGRHTGEAVSLFQKEHGLHGSGIVGPRTREALTSTHGLRITDTTHPDYPKFERTLRLVQAAEAARGIPSGAHSENIAGALLVQMRRDGIERVDRVELNDTTRLIRAVHSPDGAPREAQLATVPIDTRTASIQSLHASSDLLAQLGQPAVVASHERDRVITQAQAPAISR